MPAYVIVRAEVTDPERFKRYQQLATASVEKFGGRFLVRGGSMVTLEGSWDCPRMVVVEFPSLDQVKSWYRSPDYQQAIEARKGAAIFHMVALEGNTMELGPAR
ncbi:MAG TPA: DUF1330 domain-containing protein [Myxococcota bacterium]|nr:DUF1330 domain-containing protein [Myxococcota bacterium]